MAYDTAQANILNTLIASIKESSSVVNDQPPNIILEAGTCFVDIGINSIDYAEILSIAMEKLGVDIPLEEFANTNNITDVVNILIRKTCQL